MLEWGEGLEQEGEFWCFEGWHCGGGLFEWVMVMVMVMVGVVVVVRLWMWANSGIEEVEYGSTTM